MKLPLPNHQASTSQSRVQVSSTDTADCALTACVIAHSSLATKYLLQALANTSSIHSLLLEEFIEDPPDPQATVFIFDASSLKLPLRECMRRLQIRFAGARYLVIDKTRTVHDVVALLLLGAHGYLNDCRIAQELPEALRAVFGGSLWVTDDVLQQYVIFTRSSNRKRAPRGFAPTDRETQILELVQQRFSNKEVAQMFDIQESTVKFHLTSIFGKLQVLNRRELVDQGSSPDVWERLLTVPSADDLCSVHTASSVDLPRRAESTDSRSLSRVFVPTRQERNASA